MLLYNSQKEFIGMDAHALSALGFSDLASLRAEAADFSDLFIKTPGHISNFQHVHWIDFIISGHSQEPSKVIINVKNKNFTALLSVNSLYLTDHPQSKAFIVHLNQLRELTTQESERISGDIHERKIPKAPVESFSTPEFEEKTQESTIEESFADSFDDSFDNSFEESSHEKPREVAAIIHDDPYETPIEIDFDAEDEALESVQEAPLEKSDTPKVEQQVASDEDDMDAMLDVGDLSFDEEEPIEESPTHTEVIKEIVVENFDNGYTYDPQVASDELGLPLDLIEEFIQDFIMQAKEFKDDLYSSLEQGELDNVKILSHKLKGVAANLRIEDAFEILSIINTSADINIIRENLDILYKIIAKLAGEEIHIEVEKSVDVPNTPIEPQTTPPTKKDTPKEVEQDDLYSIEDSEVPQKIELAELADDDFVGNEIELESIETELESIENIELLELEKENVSKEPTPELALEEEPALEIALEEEPTPALEEEPALEIALEEEPAPELALEEEPAPELALEEEPAPELALEEEPTLEITLEEEPTLAIEEEPALEIALEEEPTLELALEEEPTLALEEGPESSIEIEYRKKAVASEIGLDLESFDELIQDYIDEGNEIVQTVRGAIAKSDFALIKHEIIKLRGMSDNMRVKDITAEIDILMHSEDTVALKGAIANIDAVLMQISKLED